MPYETSAEAPVNVYTSSRQSEPQTLALNDGGYITVWSGAGPTDPGFGYNIYLQRFDASGQRVGGEVVVNTTTVHAQHNPEVTLLAAGGYAVTWDNTVPGGQPGDPEALGVFAQAFDAAGAPIGAEVQVSESGYTQRITGLGDGGYIVTWTHTAETSVPSVMARLFDAAGQPRAAAFALSQDFLGSDADVAATDDGFIGVWRAYNDNNGDDDYDAQDATIAIQAFNATGGRIGDTIHIAHGGYGAAPDIIRLAQGGFALVWLEADGLYGRILSDDGQPAGERFLVQAAPEGTSLLHSVIATPDGGFTVAWDQSARPEPGAIGVAAFFADGSRNGQAVIIREGVSTPGEPPGLAILASGEVIVTYARYVGDIPNYYDVFQLRLTMTAEPITGSTGDDRLTGGEGQDRLYGLAGDDVLDGGAGADVMQGREGDDTYIVDNAGDRVVEGSFRWGVDTVRSSVSHALGANVETLLLTGSAGINGAGNAMDNSLTGNAGRNVLDGKAGADTMQGREGNDTYIVDNAGDRVIEGSFRWGVDLVRSSVSHTLANNVENLILTGSDRIHAAGNGLDNVIVGNANNNTIRGKGGADTLTGGQGNDTFDYDATSDSTASAYDILTDLTDTDRIDLSTIDANVNRTGNQGFVIVDRFTKVAGQMTVKFYEDLGVTSILMDVNGDGKADMKIVATGDHHDFTNFIF